MRTFGVEEELLIVDPGSGEPLALVDGILAAAGDQADAEREFKLEQVETQTRPCSSYTEVLAQLRHGRAALDRAARDAGARIAALATSPVRSESHVSPGERFAAMAEEFRLTSQEQLTCGMHVHVSITSREEGVGILDRIREWVPLLVALSANSPFWNGTDTGYASYRTQAWNRWPTAGPQEPFGSVDRYERLVTGMLGTGAILDEGMLYFDARLSMRHPTVEVRAADVCLRVADSALIAVLVRALVETAGREAAEGRPPLRTPAAILRLASWRASRSGLHATLVHPLEGRAVPAGDAVGALLAHLAPVLAENAELAGAERAVRFLLARGSGEQAQREAADDGGGLAGVVRAAVAATQQHDDRDDDAWADGT